ncbi:anti-sigma factor domain-containing protein [Evansella sp. LMS18]|uniref:anti-sigma factor domain-containing protein n=1 Tax=Evansella sp. LMS18 TaxID=2924033 RepID=UPI0020D1F0BC|nr:anti-sigma factor domain-containing protein [Evansella sp. LMS18]UTR09685.1 anti-sigma factor domain-containing protein [Evansella sp. LMS18]
MKKGVVMEKNKRYMIVMTGRGEFVRARLNRRAEVGEEVAYMPASFFQYPVYKNKAYSLPLTAGLIILLVYPAFTFFSPEKVHGVVALDMNPSIEFSVDEEFEVVSVYGYNEEGRDLLAELDGKLDGRPLYMAVEAAIEQGFGTGIMSEPRDIYISSPLNLFDEMTWGGSYEEWVESMQDEFTANFITLSLEEQIMREAREVSLSPVKYLLFNDAVSEGHSIDISEVKNETIHNIEGDTGKEVTALISPENVKVSRTEHEFAQKEEAAETIDLDELINGAKAVSFQVPEQNESAENNGQQDHNEADQEEERNSSPAGKSDEHPSENRNSSAEKSKKPENHPSQLKEKNSSKKQENGNGNKPETKGHSNNSQGKGNSNSEQKSNSNSGGNSSGNKETKGNSEKNSNNGNSGNKGNQTPGESKGNSGNGQGKGSPPKSESGGKPGGPGGNPGKGNK